MAKKQYIVKLTGRLADGTVASTKQAEQVQYFTDEEDRFVLWPSNNPNRYNLKTSKGQYELTHHGELNKWMGIIGTPATKVHFTKKKIVGKLIYWSN